MAIGDKIKGVIGVARNGDDEYEHNAFGNPTPNGMKPVQPQRKQEPKKRPANIQRLSRLTAIAAGVAVVSLLFGSYMTFTANSRLQAVDGQTQRVVVATTDIGPGQEIESANVTVKEVFKDSVPANAETETANVVGKKANGYIASGAAVTAGNVTGEGASTAAARLEEGKVAISITVSQQTGVAGLVHQGDSVSVLSVENNSEDASATVLTQHAKVIALDASLDGYDSEYTALTLMVEPQAAQKIATSLNTGQVSVVLESSEDQEQN